MVLGKEKVVIIKQELTEIKGAGEVS